jgi:hypothetical protein
MIHLYYLTDTAGVVKYVGLTKNPSSRKSEHKRNKPKHIFSLIEEFDNATSASNAEVEHIETHSTHREGWNRDPGGNYDTASGHNRKGVGGRKKGSVPWNKGLTKNDPRVAANVKAMAATKKAQGFYDDCAKYLPKKFGEANHMKNPEHRERMSNLAKTRYRINNDDGTWRWGYRD